MKNKKIEILSYLFNSEYSKNIINIKAYFEEVYLDFLDKDKNIICVKCTLPKVFKNGK